MDLKEILGTLFVIFLTAILFTPMGSNAWRLPLVFGILLGIMWFFKK